MLGGHRHSLRLKRALADACDGSRVIIGAEYGRPGDNHVGAGIDRERGIFAILPAVDLDPGIEAFGNAKTAQIAYFRQHLRQKCLPAKPRIDGHHQHDITEMQHVLNEGDGAGRIEHGARFLSQLPNARQHAVEVHR